MQVQSILIPKNYQSKKIDLKEAKRVMLSLGGKFKKVDITEHYYRFRQVPPNKFHKESFKSKIIKHRVILIVGFLKNPK